MPLYPAEMAIDAVELAQVREMVRSGRARTIRERAALSQAEIAAELGVHETTVSHWELGVRSPSSALASRYGRLLRKLAEVVP